MALIKYLLKCCGGFVKTFDKEQILSAMENSDW